MDQQQIKEAAEYFRGREHETLDRAKSTKHLRVLVAAAESLLAGVPCKARRRGAFTNELIISTERYVTANLPFKMKPNEVVDAVIVRLPSEITPPTEPTQ